MNCPACRDEVLVMADRQGIEIDYCPRCRGVWMDRGELDKVIERSMDASGSSNRRGRDEHDSRPRERERRDWDDDDRPRQGKKKSRGFLGELFD